MMKAVSVAVRPPNLYVQSLGISWVHLLPIHCGVILIGTGLSAEDLGFESPLCRYHSSWILWLRSVRELLPRKAGWVQHQHLVRHRCMQFVHKELVFNRWRCVSPEEKAHPRDPWWRILPLISITNLQFFRKILTVI